MSHRVSCFILVAACLLTICTLGHAQSANGAFFYSLYSDYRAVGVGDIVQVIISESAVASHSSTRANEKSADSSAGPGAGLLDFIPLIGYSGKAKSAASGTSQSRDLLTARITAVVVAVTPAGNLVIEGQRRVACNRDFQTIRLRGEVRPCDITRDNTVLSQYLANAQIEYEGPDPAHPGSRVGVISRLLGWLF